jgi:hypothetical protein
MWAADGGFHVEHHYTRIDEAPLGETVPKRSQDWYAEAGAVVSAGLATASPASPRTKHDLTSARDPALPPPVARPQDERRREPRPG